MMETVVFNNITIIVSVTVVVLAMVTPFINGFFRKPKSLLASTDYANDQQKATLPPVSIILTPNENAYELEQNLPMFLNQDYPAPFQIIVVTWKGDSETDDVLKRYEGNSHLYTTYIPDSSRYMSRKKLAITLGIKAAKTQWVMLTDITCTPASDQWLQTMASHCSDNIDIVAGYTAYDNATSDYKRFERLHTEMYLIREYLKTTPYRHNGNNLMFRKDMFINGDGYRGNLKYLRGEYDFIVNKYANSSNTTLVLTPQSWMIEQQPSAKTWKNKHLFYLENRKAMERSSRHRTLFNIDQIALHTTMTAIIAALVYSIFTQQWIVAIAAGVAFIITAIARTIIGYKALKMFQEDISPIKVFPFDIAILWHNIGYTIKHATAQKTDFISHKI